MYDRIRLASFAHRIAKADRVVGTYARSSASLTLTGEDARSVVRAVSLAAPHRPPFGMASSCSYFSKAMFYNGTNVLDYVVVCGPYFLIHSDPPYEDETKVLEKVFDRPLSRLMSEAGAKQDSK
jgi:hypothetical protein